MNTKLHVGNLAYSVTEADLRELFAQVGTVIEIMVVTERDSGRSKGFGFVEMDTPEAASKALQQFNGHALAGKQIKSAKHILVQTVAPVRTDNF